MGKSTISMAIFNSHVSLRVLYPVLLLAYLASGVGTTEDIKIALMDTKNLAAERKKMAGRLCTYHELGSRNLM